MRYLRCAALALAALGSGACFQFSTVLRVNLDGSGTIEQRLFFTQAALTQLRQFAALGGARAQDVDPLSEQQARDAAASFGPGVTYVSSMPIASSVGQGRDVTYAFRDVNQLRLAEAPPPPGGMSISAPNLGTDARVAFSMTRGPDGIATLRILAPRLAAGLASNPTGGGGGLASPDQLALVGPMFVGATLTLAVEPNGQIVRTNSAFVDGRRVTLLDVDLDQVLASDALLQKARAASSDDERRALLKQIPGLTINDATEITIEFKP